MKYPGFKLEDVANLMTVFQPAVLFLFWLLTHKKFHSFWQKWKNWVVTLSIVASAIGLWKQGWLAWLAAPVSIPVWGVILAAVPVILCVALIIREMFKSSSSVPTFEDYKSDMIFGIRWNWVYHLGQIEPDLVNAFCPNDTCRCRLSHSWYLDRSNSIFNCPNCGFHHTLEGDEREVHRRVAIEIERRVNTGEFIKALG
ncbi:hypothetical protein [Prosthecobacter sp.]|uniref:hypothetical protein n=1 Tax=Prosthecobacter sp. TaxID=1965333 RepID=UPI003784E5ED